MTTVVFLKDAFVGAAGSIASRTPDVGPVGITWSPDSNLLLTGSGGVVGSGSADLGGYNNNYPFDWTGGAYLDLHLVAGAGDTIEARIGKSTSGNFYTLDIACGGPGVDDIQFRGGYSGLTKSGSGPVLTAGAPHRVLLVYKGIGATDIYLDGALVIADALSDNYANSTTMAELTIGALTTVVSYELGMGIPPLPVPPAPPPFWTSYQRCFETDS